MFCIPCCCVECFYVTHYLLPFFIFMHLHLASYLGTLDAPREDEMIEPNPKIVFGRPKLKMEGLDKC
jgi:hypothetical protein